MRARLVASIFAVVPAALLLLDHASAAPRDAPARATPADKPVLDKSILKRPSKKETGTLTVTGANGAPGQTKTLEAVLTGGDAPVAQRYVTFTLRPKAGPLGLTNAGSASTDATGRAKLSFVIPEVPAGLYVLKASFPGDGDVTAASAEAEMTIEKADTSIVLGPEVFSFPDVDGGPPPGPRIRFSLHRRTDLMRLPKPVAITINGVKFPPLSGMSDEMPLPTNATEWNVKMEYAGSTSYNASSAERVYKK